MCLSAAAPCGRTRSQRQEINLGAIRIIVLPRYVQPVEDTYGLDPVRIRVDKEQQLGKGNYGVVYRGTLAAGLDDTAAALDVAVKMLPQDRDVEERERRQREAAAQRAASRAGDAGTGSSVAKFAKSLRWGPGPGPGPSAAPPRAPVRPPAPAPRFLQPWPPRGRHPCVRNTTNNPSTFCNPKNNRNCSTRPPRTNIVGQCKGVDGSLQSQLAPYCITSLPLST